MALASIPAPAAAEPIMVSLDVTGPVELRDSAILLLGNITVRAGGRLVLDHTTIQVQMDVDNSREIRVESGGELWVVNGTRIYSKFISPAYSLHYRVFVQPGAHFVLQNSTIDSSYWLAIGDEAAILENSVISHAVMGLHGFNLTVSNVTFFDSNIGFWLSGHSRVRDSRVDVNAVYGGFLEGTSAVENTSFSASENADLVLLDSAVATNTTHRNSGRAVILYSNGSLLGADIEGMRVAGVQLGAEDFKWGCGIFIRLIDWTWPDPYFQRLNLHEFPYFYRTNNTVTIKDVS